MNEYKIFSLKQLIRNKGICFGSQDTQINCDLCVLSHNCNYGIDNDYEKDGDLYYQRYLIAVSIAREELSQEELFELLL